MMKKPILLLLLLISTTVLLHAQGEAVDLGLSVKWASCNMGASKPHAFGNYYAWGETQPKTEYTEENNRYYAGTTDYTIGRDDKAKIYSKYWFEFRNYGTTDGKTCLEAEDDVAQTATHGQWRMPTREEFDELIRECTWTWTKKKGVGGYEVVSKKNGNSIFLPAAGYMKDAHLLCSGRNGFYWTSSLQVNATNQAYYMGFQQKQTQRYPNGTILFMTTRGFGFTVRAVQPKRLQP